MLRPDQDRAFVIHFDREVELLQDLTASREQLDTGACAATNSEASAAQTRRAQGRRLGTRRNRALRSVLLASEDLLRKQSGRKALILLTDGVDNGSQVGLSRAIESAQRADALVYSILFSDRDAYDGVFASTAGKKAMQRISHETGGGYFEVSDAKPISAIYMQLEEELRDQYSIGYTPDRSEAGTAAGPGYRKIHLAAKRSGLLVETRDGYYSIR